MKRIFLTIALVACVVLAGMAQTANRKGFFLEAQAGTTVGDVLTLAGYGFEGERSYTKGGATAGIHFGYRFATSTHFAIEAKVGGFYNFAIAKEGYTDEAYQIQVLPGLRWTSNDFGSMSAYVSLNTGVGFDFGYVGYGCDSRVSIPLEIGAGLNVTRKLYVGLSYTEFIYGKSLLMDRYFYVDGERYALCLNSYGCLQVKLGYRF